MDLKTFFENFDTLAEAPGGIARLRELILDMAVRGKLVPQDPADESAESALKMMQEEKISAENERGRNVRKKHKKNTESYELSLELQENWIAADLDSVCLFVDYRGKTPKKVGAGIRLITAKNVRDSFIKVEPREFVTEKTYHEWMTRGIPKKGDVLFTTEAPLGKAALVDIDERFALAQRVINLHPFSGLDGKFLMWSILSPWFQNELVERATGMTAKGIKAAKLKLVRIPLPPLTEQKRIVAKVDELMALCDRAEAAQQTRNTLRQNLRASALDALMNATSDTELDTAWEFVHDQWDTLCDRPEDVESLRQVVVETAVRGRLSEQKKEDQPVRVALRELAKRKEELIEKGNLKKVSRKKKKNTINPSHQLPDGWEWAKAEDAFLVVTDGDHQAPPKTDKGIPFLVIGNVSKGILDFSQTRYVSEEYFDNLDWIKKPKSGDILYTVTGSYGISIIVETDISFCVQRHIAILKTSDLFSVEYLKFSLSSLSAKEFASEIATGIAQKTVPLSGLRRLPLRLPPLAEQKRIVAKVDELMKQCDRLETTLRRKQKIAEALVASAISHVSS